MKQAARIDAIHKAPTEYIHTEIFLTRVKIKNRACTILAEVQNHSDSIALFLGSKR